MRPHSELQKAVLALYRDVLRYARTRPVEQRAQVQQYARAEFSKPLPKTNTMRIEYLLGRGRRQLQMLQMSGTRGVQVQQR